jgi:hypothetical protein
MGPRNLLKRIENAESALKAQSIFSPGCICFPENERADFRIYGRDGDRKQPAVPTAWKKVHAALSHLRPPVAP